MKLHILAVIMLAFAVAALAVPRNKRQAYDEPRLSNEVIPSIVEEADESVQEVVTASSTETDEDGLLTTRTPALDDAPTSRPGNKKKRPNSPHVPDTFSRVIDDIFNIPISVLRAVNTLLSNAFGTKQTAETPVPASPST